MRERTGRKTGTSRGSQSARKQGFYSRVLDEAERLDFELASGVEGIDDEIALLRVELKKAIAGGDSKNLRILVEATNALERLIRTRYRITKEQRKGLKEAIGNVLRDIGIPLDLEGVYKWIVFLPNKGTGTGALNRYYGLFESGKLKLRGIELRKHDTPEFIRKAQSGMLDVLSKGDDSAGFRERTTTPFQ